MELASVRSVCITDASIPHSAAEEGRAKVDQRTAPPTLLQAMCPPRRCNEVNTLSGVPSSSVASSLHASSQIAEKFLLVEVEVPVAQDPSLGRHRCKQNRTRAWRCKACGDEEVFTGLGLDVVCSDSYFFSSERNNVSKCCPERHRPGDDRVLCARWDR